MNAASYGLDGSEAFDLVGLNDAATPARRSRSSCIGPMVGPIRSADAAARYQMEIDYVRQGGIMPYVLNELTKGMPAHAA